MHTANPLNESLLVNKALIFQPDEKERLTAELIIANEELIFQNKEKEERAAELLIANQELLFQNEEKGRRSAELVIANLELLFQNSEKEKRAAELLIANEELLFQNEEKEKRAAELLIANKELAYQHEEKIKRAAELIIANKELLFQNEEKENRAAELIIANKALVFENEEKQKRAAELIIANEELLFQNAEKENRAAELSIANKELAFQNEEKIARAAELIITNRQLMNANEELIAFTYISSHDLQEPLRKIQTFISVLLEKEERNLSDHGKFRFQRIQAAAARMQQLISDLLDFSRINSAERKFELAALDLILEDIKEELSDTIQEKKAIIEIREIGYANIIPFQFRQLLFNLLDNALKFSIETEQIHIIITNEIVKGNTISQDKALTEKEYYRIRIQDNGIGFEPEFSKRIFQVFQKLHNKEEYAGTGIGLAIVKKIVDNHNGMISATSQLGQGATFDIYIPLKH